MGAHGEAAGACAHCRARRGACEAAPRLVRGVRKNTGSRAVSHSFSNNEMGARATAFGLCAHHYNTGIALAVCDLNAYRMNTFATTLCVRVCVHTFAHRVISPDPDSRLLLDVVPLPDGVCEDLEISSPFHFLYRSAHGFRFFGCSPA